MKSSLALSRRFCSVTSVIMPTMNSISPESPFTGAVIARAVRVSPSLSVTRSSGTMMGSPVSNMRSEFRLRKSALFFQ